MGGWVESGQLESYWGITTLRIVAPLIDCNRWDPTRNQAAISGNISGPTIARVWLKVHFYLL